MLSTGGLLSLVQLAFMAGCSASRIVSLPHQRYVLEGNQATVRCQNRSDDDATFYSYITNAIWYRDYQNGTIIQIGNSQSDSVYADKHTLRFSFSMTYADEGVYYCCVPDGPCGNSTSAHTTALISTPPVISATVSTHISATGSNVTLSCTIIAKGRPPAPLLWRRNGQEIGDDGTMSVNDTTMTLTLYSVTVESTGLYICAATGVLSYRSDAVELLVESAPQWSTITVTIKFGSDVVLPCVANITSPLNYTWEQISTQTIIPHDTSNNIFGNGSLLLTNVQNADTYKCTAIDDSAQGITIQFVELVIEMPNNSETTKSQIVYLKNEIVGSSCHDNELEEYLMVILQRFLNEMCGCTDTKVLVNCNDTGASSTVYSVQFVGPMADDLLKTWLKVETNSDNEIELGVATFTPCNQTCDGVVTYSEVMPDNNESLSSLQIGIITGVIVFIVIIIVIISAPIAICYYKSFHSKDKYAIKHRARTSDSTCSESGLMESPPANYDKLNHIKY